MWVSGSPRRSEATSRPVNSGMRNIEKRDRWLQSRNEFDRRQPSSASPTTFSSGQSFSSFSSEIGVAAIHLQPAPPTLFASFPFAYPFSF